MKISELIDELLEMKEEAGDIEVTCLMSLANEAQNEIEVQEGKVFETTIEHLFVRSEGSLGKRVMVTL
jgi:hypothetical protein